MIVSHGFSGGKHVASVVCGTSSMLAFSSVPHGSVSSLVQDGVSLVCFYAIRAWGVWGLTFFNMHKGNVASQVFSVPMAGGAGLSGPGPGPT